MWINTNWSLIDRFLFFFCPMWGGVMFNISIWSNICSHGTSFSDSRRISDRPRCDFAVCRRSSPSLRYSDRFLCAAYFVLLHGALTLPIACHSILPTLIRMWLRGILRAGHWQCIVHHRINNLHYRTLWQAQEKISRLNWTENQRQVPLFTL